MGEVVALFFASTIRTATPLALAALGETLAERAGIINVGLEGLMIAGALGTAIVASLAGPAVGLLAGVVVGVGVALILGLWIVVIGADQIIAGTAVTLGALGVSSALYRVVFGSAGAGLTIPTLKPIVVPGLSPFLGASVFQHPATTYLVIAIAAGLTLFLFRTSWGLSWRAVGEAPAAAYAAGVSLGRVRMAAVLMSGALAGLAGGSLVVAQVGTFADGMTAGRGFIAIAIVTLGRWRPWGVVGAALLFGSASALQYVFQSLGTGIPYQAFLALPYLLALAVLATGSRGSTAPAFLGRRIDPKDLL